ncbi:right-handed parallel beta-helix repeat-containing protein [Rummeliibacillus pycnus]|uniref:right-handed parallel beta-helix repeat-containing protein n=1 Tax=Rummeliibacillus pycnus TaxID=101070 RepID=UPI000C9C1754|nr:right-handed parallel beta-helix repeat-containing protein [Rummeliibacillus pycnus]
MQKIKNFITCKRYGLFEDVFKKAMLLSVLLFLFSYPEASADSPSSKLFYVSENGDDSNLGTINAPWRTIQKAANSLKAGETVYVREGIYSEFVKINNSGTKEAGDITFKAYPGENPILDAGKMAGDSGNSTFFDVKNSNYIVINGFEMRNITTNDPNQYPVAILVREGSSNIKILNNNIHDISNYSINGNAHGIQFYGDSSNSIHDITIQNNEIHHLTLGSSEALTLSGNIEGFLINQNKIHHNNNIGIDVAGFYKACNDDCIDQARNGTISNNIVYHNTSEKNPAYKGSFAAGGIYADGATNILIKNNFVYKNDFGIELASENQGKTTSNITVEKNKIINNNGAGIIMGGSSVSNGGAYKNIINENEFTLNDRLSQGYGEITLQQHVTENQFLNNKFYINKTTNLIQTINKKEKSNTIKNNKVYFKIFTMPEFKPNINS